MNSFLNFEKQETPKERKTAIYNVWTGGKDHDEEGAQVAELGIIKWHPAWRRYAFFPNEDTLYDADCLNEVETFLRELMTARKAETSE
jgi:hypothetical protein